jgi:CubicO group peptidase (beta-lactamase class C family)
VERLNREQRRAGARPRVSLLLLLPVLLAGRAEAQGVRLRSTGSCGAPIRRAGGTGVLAGAPGAPHGNVPEYVAEEELPGAVILVARHGKVAYLEAFGMLDRERALPMPTDAVFRIASQTKALVSVAVMMLQEEGKLLLSDPVGKYLPEFRSTTVAVSREGGYDVVPARRPITLRDLLTHTAGIGYGSGVARDRWEAAGIQGWYFAHRNEPVAATVARMAALPFDAHPGDAFVYGYGTDILGVVVEVVGGLPLDEFLRRRILEPLGMKDTHFFLPRRRGSGWPPSMAARIRRFCAGGRRGEGCRGRGITWRAPA